MKLIYRGTQIDYSPRSGNTGKPMPASQSEPYTISYRGVRLTVDPNAPQKKAPLFPNGYDLIYRGVSLHVSPQGIVQPLNNRTASGLIAEA